MRRGAGDSPPPNNPVDHCPASTRGRVGSGESARDSETRACACACVLGGRPRASPWALGSGRVRVRVFLAGEGGGDRAGELSLRAHSPLSWRLLTALPHCRSPPRQSRHYAAAAGGGGGGASEGGFE